MEKCIFLLFLPFCCQVLFAQSFPQSFARYYFNNGSLEDSFGNIDAKKVGNIIPATDRFGNINHAFAFSDSTAISLGDNFNIFSTPGAKFSFSFWIKNQNNKFTS